MTINSPAKNADPRPGFGAVFASEWTKLRSVRSTLWALIAAAVLYLLGTIGLIGVTVSSWDDLSQENQMLVARDPAATILGSGFLIAQVATIVLGVLVASSEYTSGSIRTAILAVPRRTPLLLMKAATLAVVVFGVMLVTSLVAFFAGAAMLSSKVPVSIGDPGVFRAVLGTAMYMTLLALFSLAIGFVVRSSAGGITFMLILVLVVSPMVQLIPGRAGDLHSYLPTEAGILMGQATKAPGDLMTPWQGFGVFGLWTAVVLVIALVLLERRDA